MSKLSKKIAIRWLRASGWQGLIDTEPQVDPQEWLNSFESGEERDVMFMPVGRESPKRGTIVFDGHGFEIYTGLGQSFGVLDFDETLEVLKSGDVQLRD